MGNIVIKRSPKGIHICDMVDTGNGEILVHLKYKKNDDYVTLLKYIMIIMGCEGDEETCDQHYCKSLNIGCLLKKPVIPEK